MLQFQQKRRLRAVLSSPLVQGVLLLLAGFVAWNGFTRYQIATEMQERRAVAETEAQALKDRKASLETQVEYLESERGQEAEMRRQFDVARDGEQVVIILEEEVQNE